MATNFSLSHTLGDHMVLQRAPQAATVWGFAAPGTVVTTTFNSQKYTARAGADTIWRQALAPTAAGGPYTIVFSASTGQSASLTDVLFGDVYLCGGQSNMQFSVPALTNVTEEAALANNYPHIRLFTVGQKTQSGTPLLDLQTIEQLWAVANNNSVAYQSHDGFGYFSAVCWLFGRHVSEGLGNKVPIGLVSNNWGGTAVELWSPPSAFTACHRTPSGGTLYNAMIHPYTIGPMALTGFTWYQGESNTGAQPAADNYACLFPAMITAWRQEFNNLGAYFGFIQLSTWCISSNQDAIPQMRVAQMAALSLPKVGYGTNADHGAGCNIHPPPKQYCSARMASSALALQYGQAVVWKSPTYASAAVSGPASVTVTLHDVTPAGLQLLPPANLPTVNCDQQKGNCAWAALQFNDAGKTWVNASVSLGPSKQTLVLSAAAPAGATAPVASSYGWAPIPMLTAYLADHDLPVLPWLATL